MAEKLRGTKTKTDQKERFMSGIIAGTVAIPLEEMVKTRGDRKLRRG